MEESKPRDGFFDGLPSVVWETVGTFFMLAFVVACLVCCLVLIIVAIPCELVMYACDKIATALGYGDPERPRASLAPSPERP